MGERQPITEVIRKRASAPDIRPGTVVRRFVSYRLETESRKPARAWSTPRAALSRVRQSPAWPSLNLRHHRVFEKRTQMALISQITRMEFVFVGLSEPICEISAICEICVRFWTRRDA